MHLNWMTHGGPLQALRPFEQSLHTTQRVFLPRGTSSGLDSGSPIDPFARRDWTVFQGWAPDPFRMREFGSLQGWSPDPFRAREFGALEGWQPDVFSPMLPNLPGTRDVVRFGEVYVDALNSTGTQVWFTASGQSPARVGTASGGDVFVQFQTAGKAFRVYDETPTAILTMTDKGLAISTEGSTSVYALDIVMPSTASGKILRMAASGAGGNAFSVTQDSSSRFLYQFDTGFLDINVTADTTTYGVDILSSTNTANNKIFRCGLSGSTNGFTVAQNASNEIVYAFEFGARDGRLVIGTTDGTARLHVLEDDLGTDVFNLTTTSTNDDPTYHIRQNRVATTDATLTTLDTIAITASKTYLIEARVVARRTGGTSGTADDGAVYIRQAMVTTKAGTVTINATATPLTQEDQAGWDCQLNVSGTNILLQIQGAANNNVVWHSTTIIQEVGT